jgi:hypothetical protein
MCLGSKLLGLGYYLLGGARELIFVKLNLLLLSSHVCVLKLILFFHLLMYYGEWQVLWCSFSFSTCELGNCNLVLFYFVFNVLEVSSANWFLSYVLGFQEARKLKFETWTRFVVCGKFHEFGFVFCWLVNFHIGLFIKRVAIVTFFFFNLFIGTLSQIFFG